MGPSTPVLKTIPLYNLLSVNLSYSSEMAKSTELIESACIIAFKECMVGSKETSDSSYS